MEYVSGFTKYMAVHLEKPSNLSSLLILNMPATPTRNN